MRISLALLNCIGIHRLRKAIVRRYGTTAGYFLIFICSTQFHLMFYLGRPLPNTFATALVTYAIGCYLDEVGILLLLCVFKKNKTYCQLYTPFICLLTFCCVIIRCDTLVLFAPFLLYMLLTHRIGFLRMAALGILTGVLSLLLSVGDGLLLLID